MPVLHRSMRIGIVVLATLAAGCSPTPAHTTTPTQTTAPPAQTIGPKPTPGSTSTADASAALVLPTTGRIGYSVDTPSKVEARVIDLATGMDTVVADGPFLGWAPDGLGFLVGCPRTVIDGPPALCRGLLEGGNAVRIAPAGVGPLWSPNGDAIAFGQSPIDQGDFWLVGPDATGLMTIGGIGTPSSWSPDGLWIAAESAQGATVVVVRRDGTGLRVLGPGRSPAWSPDGLTIAATTWPAGPDIESLDVANGTMTVIADPVAKAGPPMWSRSGRIAFIAGGDVFTIVLGGGATGLTQGLGASGRPSWSPDGRWIAVEAANAGVREIILVNAAGGWIRLTTSGTASGPFWAPIP